MRLLVTSALIAVGLVASVDAHAQSNILITPAQVVSSAKDCIASFDNHRFKKDKLKRLGWAKVKIDSMGGLEQIMQAWLRKDGVLMLTMQTGCIVKVRMTPESRVDIAAFDHEFGSNSPLQHPDKRVWHIDDFELELTSGPPDGSNVNLSIRWFFEPSAERGTAPTAN